MNWNVTRKTATWLQQADLRLIICRSYFDLISGYSRPIICRSYSDLISSYRSWSYFHTRRNSYV